MALSGSGTLIASGQWSGAQRNVTATIYIVDSIINWTVRSTSPTRSQPATRITLKHSFNQSEWGTIAEWAYGHNYSQFPSSKDGTQSGAFTLTTPWGAPDPIYIRLGVGIGHNNDTDASQVISITRADDTPTYQFNFNILDPQGNETGCGKVDFEVNGQKWTQIENEPQPSMYLVGTRFLMSNFTPGQGLSLDYVEGATPIGSNQWECYQLAEYTTVNFHTKVSENQNVYVYDDGRVYARSFVDDINAKTVSIGNNGDVYARGFVKDTGAYIDSGAYLHAKEFIRGNPPEE